MSVIGGSVTVPAHTADGDLAGDVHSPADISGHSLISRNWQTPRPNQHTAGWSADRLLALKEMIAEGLPYSQIAERPRRHQPQRGRRHRSSLRVDEGAGQARTRRGSGQSQEGADGQRRRAGQTPAHRRQGGKIKLDRSTAAGQRSRAAVRLHHRPADGYLQVASQRPLVRPSRRGGQQLVAPITPP
jgi:hypothetical protein